MSKYLIEVKKLKCHNDKYLKIYCQLITKRINEKPDESEYTENHHILPRSLCQTLDQENDKENLVKLSAREHFLAHALLCKFTKRKEMYDAFFFMMPNTSHKRRYKPKLQCTYEKLKRELCLLKSENMRGDKHFNYGKTQPEETKHKISKTLQGRKRPAEHAEASRKGQLQRYKDNPDLKGPNAGKKNSTEQNLKNSEQNKNVVKTEEWNMKNQQANTGRIHIANTITKERRRPFADEANELIRSQNGVWIKLATMKPIPDYSSIESIISSISESDAIGEDNVNLS